MNYRLSKKESLKSKKYFDAIFAKGSSVKKFPIRAVYIEYNSDNFPDLELPTQSQVAFSVPKKRFKRAVDRNRIKRLMRESYRLNKHRLNKNYAIIWVYLDKEHSDYQTIEDAVRYLLNEIEK